MNSGNKLAIHDKGLIYIYDHNDIRYCKSDDCYATIHLQCGKEILVIKTLAKVERELDSEQFIRVNQSFLINKDYIAYIDKRNKQIVLNNSFVIPFTVSVKKLISFFSNKKSVQEQ